MDCLSFRRQLWTDPGSNDPAMDAHRAACGACAAEYRRVHELESGLRDALQVPVPADLERRILERVQAPRSPNKPANPRLALAAALLLGVAVGGLATWQWDANRRAQPALDLALLKVFKSDDAPLRMDATVEPEQVPAVLAKLGARLAGSPGPIHYAKSCTIRGQDAVHLVLGDNAGRVTVFLLPAERSGEQQSLIGDRVNGVIMPLGRGSMALLGASSADLRGVAERIRRSLVWNP